MRPTLFISDLHLSPERPHINRLFFNFLKTAARQSEALYILGDLFEYWAGDDDLADPFNASIVAALKDLSECGVKLFFLHGNRDLLIASAFADASGATLLPDPTLTRIGDVPTLLMHGDTLCTDDTAYQTYRAQVHAPVWQNKFLSRPLAERKAFIRGLLDQSRQEKSGKPETLMDVTQDAVEAVLRQHGYPRLIHGHTHRPARHEHYVNGKICERYVLADWYERGEYLRCDAAGCETIKL